MQRALRWFLALGAVSLAVACGKPDPTDESPWMRPGEDCLSCHKEGGEAEDKVWSVGGTLFASSGDGAEGAQVFIKDASGRAVTLTANGAGNFYTGETLTPPFQKIAVVANGQTIEMPDSFLPASTGACNQCHVQGGIAGSRIVVPGP